MSIKKVANIAGVSIATVSRFFNNPNQVSQHTKEKVEAAIKEVNYSPNALAQNLRRGKTGLLIAVLPQITSPVYEPMLNYLNRAATERGYTLLAKQAQMNSLPLSYYQHMLNCKQADGFIVLSGIKETFAQSHESLPIIMACEPPEGDTPTSVIHLTIDHHAAAKEATNHLIELGHKTIGFIYDNVDVRSSQNLKSGYLEAINNAGLQFTNNHSMVRTNSESIGDTLKTVMEHSPKTTALICCDYDLTLASLKWLKRNGIEIPEQLSLVGFNDNNFMELTDPPITTISQPMEDLAQSAMDKLFAILEGEPDKISLHTPLSHQLIVRGSTALACI